MPKFEDTEGFVLIGGKSRRMQTDKASIIFQNKTFLEIAHNALLPNCAKISFVANQTQDLSKLREDFPCVRFLRDANGKIGVTNAVLTALKNSRLPKTFIVACDFPLINAETILQINQALHENEDFDAVVPSQNEHGRQPLCAVYKTSCAKTFEEILNTEANSAMNYILDKLKVLEISQKKIMQNGISPLLNANTPSELADAEKMTLIQHLR